MKKKSVINENYKNLAKMYSEVLDKIGECMKDPKLYPPREYWEDVRDRTKKLLNILEEVIF